MDILEIRRRAKKAKADVATAMEPETTESSAVAPAVDDTAAVAPASQPAEPIMSSSPTMDMPSDEELAAHMAEADRLVAEAMAAGADAQPDPPSSPFVEPAAAPVVDAAPAPSVPSLPEPPVPETPVPVAAPQPAVSSPEPTPTDAVPDTPSEDEGKRRPTEAYRLEQVAKAERELLAQQRALDPLGDFLVRYDEVDGDAMPSTSTPQATQHHRRYLAFTLEREDYAVSIMDVREIVNIPNVTAIPRSPPFILGVFSKRGVVMPVMDLGAVLGLRPVDRNLRQGQRILVVGEGERICGLRVDSLRQTVRLTTEDIEPMPSGGDARTSLLLTGLGRVDDENIYILLDVAALLAHLQTAVGDALKPRGGL